MLHIFHLYRKSSSFITSARPDLLPASLEPRSYYFHFQGSVVPQISFESEKSTRNNLWVTIWRNRINPRRNRSVFTEIDSCPSELGTIGRTKLRSDLRWGDFLFLLSNRLHEAWIKDHIYTYLMYKTRVHYHYRLIS